MKKLILILLTIFLVGGCSLKEEPYGFLSDSNFYKTEADAEAAILHAYSILPEIEYYTRHLYYLAEMPTEELSPKDDQGIEQHDLDELKPLPTNKIISDVWRYAYIGINRANAVIEKVPAIEMDETLKNKYVGEAYFLRALHHFNLVRAFGSVPIRTKMIDELSEVDIPKSPIKDVYAQIESDLDMAIQLIPQVPEQELGRADIDAARALLSKVYLNEASAKATGSPGYDYVEDADAKYAKAAEYASKVINESTLYGFDDDLLHIFDVLDPTSPELIFVVNMERTGLEEGNYSKIPKLLIPYVGGDIVINDMFGNSVKTVDGWGSLETEIPFYNSFIDGDLRKDLLMVNTVYLDGEPKTWPDGGLRYPFTRKFIDPDYVGDRTSAKPIVIRFSDILLVYAEAVGPTSEGYAAINKIRRRAGIPDLQEGLSITDFRDSVIQERSWELCFEGHRMWDLRRTHKVEEVLNGKYGKTIVSNPYFYDIPQTEQDLNPSLNN